MNNKTMLFMAEFHEAMLEFISMDVGKSVKADLKAIRDAHGGAKKLAEADRILADANKVYDERVAAGNEEASRAVRMADDEIKGEVQALEKKEAGLAKLKDDLSRQNAAVVQEARQLKDAALAFKARARIADEQDADIERRVSTVIAREATATRREAEIKRFDDWRATAPA